MLFWIRLTKNIFSQPFKRYQPSKLNGWYSKINKNHQGCYLAFLTHDSNLHLVFWLKSSSCNIFWPKKSTFWIFVIFYNHLHQDLNFGQFYPLAPTPWGTPLTHPPHYPLTCFCSPMSPKNVLIHKKTGWQKEFWSWQVTTSFGLFWGHFGKLLRGGVLTGLLWEAPQGYFRVLPHPPRAQNRGTEDLKPRGHFDTPQYPGPLKDVKSSSHCI